MKFRKAVEIDLINIPDVPIDETLQNSLNELKQRTPVTLVELANGRFDIVDGRRRVQNLKAIGVLTVIAQIYEEGESSPEERELWALVANSGKPNYMDEAQHVQVLVETHGHTFTAIAKACNLSVPTIMHRYNLATRLISEYQNLLLHAKITINSAIFLTKMPQDKQKELFNMDVVKNKAIKEAFDAWKQDKEKKELSQIMALDDPVLSIPVTPGYFLEGAIMESLLQNGTYQDRIEYQNRKFKIKLQEEK